MIGEVIGAICVRLEDCSTVVDGDPTVDVRRNERRESLDIFVKYAYLVTFQCLVECTQETVWWSVRLVVERARPAAQLPKTRD